MTPRLYVETSALLRALLEGDFGLRKAIEAQAVTTSALTFVEAARALARARSDGRLNSAMVRTQQRWLSAFERSCDVLLLDEAVLRRAREQFPVEPVRTLDAIHLASILDLDQQVGGITVASCDERVRRNASALGFQLQPLTA